MAVIGVCITDVHAWKLREERGPRGWFYSSDEVASGRQDSSRVRSARSEWLWVARPRTWSKCMGAPLRAAFRLRSELLLPSRVGARRPREHDVRPASVNAKKNAIFRVPNTRL